MVRFFFSQRQQAQMSVMVAFRLLLSSKQMGPGQTACDAMSHHAVANVANQPL